MDSLSWKKKADQENNSSTCSAGVLLRFGGLEGGASALGIDPPGHCGVCVLPLEEPAHTQRQWWETSRPPSPESPLPSPLTPDLMCHLWPQLLVEPVLSVPLSMFHESQNAQLVVETLSAKPRGEPGELSLNSCSWESQFIELKTQNEN